MEEEFSEAEKYSRLDKAIRHFKNYLNGVLNDPRAWDDVQIRRFWEDVERAAWAIGGIFSEEKPVVIEGMGAHAKKEGVSFAAPLRLEALEQIRNLWAKLKAVESATFPKRSPSVKPMRDISHKPDEDREAREARKIVASILSGYMKIVDAHEVAKKRLGSMPGHDERISA